MANNNLYCNAFASMNLCGVNVGAEPNWYDDKEFCKFQVAQSFGPRESGFTLWHAVTANGFQFNQLRKLAARLPSNGLKGARLDVTLVNPVAQHYTDKQGNPATSVTWTLADHQLHQGNKAGNTAGTANPYGNSDGSTVNGVVDPLYNLKASNASDVSDDDIPF